MSDDLGWRVEAACHAAWPTAADRMLDGWLLRTAGSSASSARRLNALHPTQHGPRDPAAVLARAGEALAAAGQPLRVRVPGLAAGLDAALDRLGFGPAQAESLTLIAALAPTPAGDPVSLTPRATDAWRSARVMLAGLDKASGAQLARSVAMVSHPARFASIDRDGQPVAVGYGVIVGGLLTLEAIATDAARRRQGHGRALVAALMRWAADEGAEAACLQVMADNVAALALYRGLGFGRELYRYHYRVGP